MFDLEKFLLTLSNISEFYFSITEWFNDENHISGRLKNGEITKVSKWIDLDESEPFASFAEGCTAIGYEWGDYATIEFEGNMDKPYEDRLKFAISNSKNEFQGLTFGYGFEKAENLELAVKILTAYQDQFASKN